MVTGNVYPEVERKLPQYANKTPRAVFRNLGDRTFEELVEGPVRASQNTAAGVRLRGLRQRRRRGRADSQPERASSLLRNDLTGAHNWIKVKLEGVKSNRSAIGARVLVHCGGRTQAQAVVSQSSFYSSNDPRLHFGMGTCRAADVEVFWPNGLHQTVKA